MKPTRNYGAPSSIAIGLLTVENILKQSTEPIDIKSNTEYLITILELFDLDCLKKVMSISFQILQDSSSKTHKDAIQSYISSISLHFQKSSKFRSLIVSFFDSLPNLPVNLLQIFPPPCAIILTELCCSCNSRNNIAKYFLSQKILPKATEETYKQIDESIVYDLLQLDLKNLSFNKMKLSQLYFSTSHQVIPTTDVTLELNDDINPSLYDAVLESDSRILIGQNQLKWLFDFFPGFDSKHAASFLLAISSQKCLFRDYCSKLEETQRERIIELFRQSFLDRKVDLLSIPSSLDLPNIKSIDSEGCSSVFNLIHGLLKNKKIEGHSFITEWQNKLLQIQFLSYISNNQIPDFVFNDCKMTSLNGFDPPNSPNQCWQCIDFVERILKLSESYPKEINNILPLAPPKYYPIILLTYSQIYPNKSEVFQKTSNQFFTSIIQNRNASGILQILWSTNSTFCQELFIEFYRQNPNKLGNIIESVHGLLNEVLSCNDLNFVLDLSFQASLRGSIDFSAFLATLPKRFSISAYDSVLNFIKSMVLDSSISSPVLLSKPLNALFEYFWNIFNTLSDDTKLLVNTVYSICQSLNINLDKFAFAEKLPSISTPEVKTATSDYFSKFFKNEISVVQFVQIFHQFRGSSPSLFQSMIQYLLEEAENIETRDKEFATRLGELIGHMVHENLFTEDEMKQIFEWFIKGFSAKSQLTPFSVAALEICSNKLQKQPEFLFCLLKQPLLRTLPLFEKIRKISSNMSVPINFSKLAILHHILKRFEKLPAPLPRFCKLIQKIPSDHSAINQIICTNDTHIDWVALHLVSTIQDHPKILEPALPVLLGAPQFSKIIVQAAIFESLQLIASPQFTTIEGAFARRRLSILGKLIGRLTLAVNKMIPGRFLDLKQLLLFSFSQGKLLGVVPFVAEILCVASPYFNPPNPYTSSLLQVIASIGLTDLLKLSIKNDVFRILDHFGVSPCELHLIELVPDVRQNNFDFIAPPFALSYVLSQSDIDRAVQFDDNVFNPLATQSIVIPEPRNPKIIDKNFSLKRDKMRAMITNATISFLKAEGSQLARVASSTAHTLILKDFAMCNNLDVIMEMASILTKQLSSGLTLVTSNQKLHRNICHQIQNEFSSEDACFNEWISECVQVNCPWISQMLQEVVHIKAIKIVQKKIKENEEAKKQQGQRYIDSVLQSRRHLPQGFTQIDDGLNVEQRQIYEDLAELALNPAEITVPEPSDKSIRQSPEFEKFFVQMTKLISTEIQQQASKPQDVLVDESAFSVMMPNCPAIPPEFENFLSVIKTMMKFMVKLNHSINDKIYGILLEKFVSCVPKTFVIKAQPYVVGWLRNSTPSITLLFSMIQNELITTSQLDQFFFNTLNKQPFNYRLFVTVIKFLNCNLVEKKTINPADMILSLTLVVSTPLELLETSNLQQQASMRDLKKILDELDVPLNVLPPDSKLKLMSTFDPLEEINDSDNLILLFNQLKELIDKEPENKESLEEVIRKCCEHGRDFFAILIYKGSPEYLLKIVSYLRSKSLLKENFEAITSAYLFLLEDNANVVYFEMSPYFDSLIQLEISISDDFEFACSFADFLHSLRPLKITSFTFGWIQIACENHFVSKLLSNKSGWDKMATILADFASSLIYASDMHVKEVFEMLYKSILRFILVLNHDFPDFLCSFAPELVSIIPLSMIQLRNIILSAKPSNSQVQPTIPNKLNSTPGIEDFFLLPQPSKSLIEKFKFDELIKNTTESCKTPFFKQFKEEIESKCSLNLMSSLIIYLTNSLLKNITIQQFKSPIFDTMQLTSIILNLASSLRSDAAVLFLNAAVDMVRFPCRATLFFLKALNLLLRMTSDKKDELSCDELLVRIILERASFKQPYPWGFKILFKLMMSDNKINIFDKPYIKNSEKVTQFLKKIEADFQNDKSI